MYFPAQVKQTDLPVCFNSNIQYTWCVKIGFPKYGHAKVDLDGSTHPLKRADFRLQIRFMLFDAPLAENKVKSSSVP